MAAEHHAQPTRRQSKGRGGGASREGVLHQHDRSLQSLPAVGRLDQYAGQRRPETGLHQLHLPHVGADHADLGRSERTLADLIAHPGSPGEEALDQANQRPGQLLVELTGGQRRQLGQSEAHPISH